MPTHALRMAAAAPGLTARRTGDAEPSAARGHCASHRRAAGAGSKARPASSAPSRGRLRGAGAPLRFDVDAVVIGNGFAPATELAALLGAPMSLDASTGYPAPVRDEDGKSADLPVWIAGDSGGIGGSVVAMAQGRIAGAAMLRFLGRDGPAAQETDRRARRDLARARAFQEGLWSLFAAPSAPPPTGETLVCRCENVPASTIAACRADGVRDLASLKRLTRLGMGRCQGRYCRCDGARLDCRSSASRRRSRTSWRRKRR